MIPFRTGIGYDIHQLVENRPLILGGVHVPYHMGLLGHSDADVLSHAITDALLGAAALRDIGFHFPDTDPQNKDKDSRIFLEKTLQLLKKQGYSIVNIDATIIAEAPKLQSYIPKIIESLASTLQLDLDQINIKATTNESLDSIGQNKAIATFATCLIQK